MRLTTLVHTFIEEPAEDHSQKNAIFASEKWWTFQEVNAAANQLARLLKKQGLKRGDRVAILIENSLEYVVSYYAILKSGGITVALNTESTPEDIEFIAGDCGIRFLVTNTRFIQRVMAHPQIGSPAGSLKSRLPALETTFLWTSNRADADTGLRGAILELPASLEPESPSNPGLRIIDLDIASIVYTSGSTGKPRGATLSHLNIVSNTWSIVEYLELTADDRIMAILPFYYIYGKSLLNTHFAVGGSVIIDNRFMYPNVVLQTMQKQGATGFAGVPSTFTILLRRSNLRSMTFPMLRYLTQAGGAMAPAIQKEVAKVFAPAKLFVMYGATEASARLSYLSPEDLPHKWGSIGKAIPNVDLFIADTKGNPLSPGEEGEIVARGSNIMSGYWNHPEETDKVLKNGLYYTGDLGKSDEDGFLFIIGRSKDMIKIGGNRVSAKEIEDAIYEHPAVIETAVIGVADDVLGEAPKAFLVTTKERRELIIGEMPQFLQERLAPYKIPRSYEIRDSLPKNESGKIQKLKLR